MTVCCFSKIQMGFTFLLLAHLGCPGLRAVKRVCKRVCFMFLQIYISPQISEPSNGSLCLCYEQLGLWCNFNIPWLASLPCPPIFGRRGNYSKRLDMWKRENILLKEGYSCYIFVKKCKSFPLPILRNCGGLVQVTFKRIASVTHFIIIHQVSLPASSGRIVQKQPSSSILVFKYQ